MQSIEKFYQSGKKNVKKMSGILQRRRVRSCVQFTFMEYDKPSYFRAGASVVRAELNPYAYYALEFFESGSLDVAMLRKYLSRSILKLQLHNICLLLLEQVVYLTHA